MITRRALTICVILTVAVSATCAQGADAVDDRHPGDYILNIDTSYETPHTTWASPYARGTLKALFIVPHRDGARDVVELYQRMDLDFEEFVVPGSESIGADNKYAENVQGISTEEKTELLRAKLQQDYDVIAICNFDFDAIPAELQYEILRKVAEDGTGLVFGYYRDTKRDLKRYPIEGAVEMLWEGTPLPAMGSWVDRRMEAREMDTVASIPAQVLSTWSLGEGRMAVLDWGNPPPSRWGGPGVTPDYINFSPDLPQIYDYYYALIARVLYWASRDLEPRVAFSGLGVTAADAQDGVSFALDNASGAEMPVTLKATWRLMDGSVLAESEQDLVLATASTEATVTVPETLPGGEILLDLRVVSSDGVEAWGSKQVVNRGVPTIEAVELESEFAEPGGEVEARVSLTEPATAADRLWLRLFDTDHREIRRMEIMPGSGETAVPCSISVDGLTTQAAYLVVELRDEDRLLHRTRRPVFVPTDRPDNYFNIVWAGGDGDELSSYRLRLLREAGFNASLQHPPNDPPSRARNLALHDLHWVPYSCRINEGDPRDGVRRGGWGPKVGDDSFYNPEYRKAFTDLVLERLDGVPPYKPLVYSLGDENRLRYDSYYGPHDVEPFQQFLQEQYETIEALNESWGSDFATWDDVEPVPYERRPEPENFAPQHDHMAFVEQTYGDFHRHVRAAIRGIDPDAWVGAEGSSPGDLETTMEDLEMWSPYHRRRQDLLIESLAPEWLISGNWWGGYVRRWQSGEAQRDYTPDTPMIFDHLLRGMTAGFYFHGAEGAQGFTSTGLGYPPWVKRFLPGMREIMGGTGMLINAAEPAFDRVAVHWSQPSEHGSEFDQRYGRTRNTHDALLQTFERIVIDPDYVTSKSMAEMLDARDYGIIFVPTSVAIGESDVAQLEAFAERGGVVVADLGCGTLDEHCRPREEGALDGLLGVSTDRSDPVARELSFEEQIGVTVEEAKVLPTFEATDARVLVEADGLPVVTSRQVGEGAAIALNFSLGEVLRDLETTDANALALHLLETADIRPRVQRTADPNWRVRLFDCDGFEMLAIWRRTPEGAMPTVTLPRPRLVYDIRRGEKVGKTAEVRAAPAGEDVYLFGLFSDTPRAIEIEAPESAAPGEPLQVRLHLRGAGEARVVRVEAIDANGEEVRNLRHVFAMDGDNETRTLQPAFNDALGAWTVRAVDIATGMSDEATVMVQ